MAWYRRQLKFAEGPGSWDFHYATGVLDDEDAAEIKRDLDRDNQWNHGYRGCTVEPVADDQVPLEVLMEEAEVTLALHSRLQEKLRDLAETIRLNSMAARARLTPENPSEDQ